MESKEKSVKDSIQTEQQVQKEPTIEPTKETGKKNRNRKGISNLISNCSCLVLLVYIILLFHCFLNCHKLII